MSSTSRQTGTATLVRKVKSLKPLGWDITPTTSGHRIISPQGTTNVHTSGGSDHRGWDNTLADLDRIGFTEDLNRLETMRVANRRKKISADREKVEETLAEAGADGAAAVHFSASTDDTARPAGYRGMMTRTEHITPERAQALLDREITATLSDGATLVQRALDPRHVTFLVGIIERGEWKELPAGIAFAPNGDLIDGQHRLAAIARAGKTVPVRVTYNVPPDFFAAIDTGKNRRPTDALRIHGGVSNGLNLASALKLLLIYDMGTEVAGHWNRWGSVKVSNDQIMAGYTAYPDLPEHIRYATNVAKRARMVIASVAAFRQVADRAWPEGRAELDAFCDALRPDKADVVLHRGHPALTLRNYTLRAEPRSIPYRRETLLMLLLKHWRAHMNGKEILAVRYDTTDPLPAPWTPAKRRRG